MAEIPQELITQILLLLPVNSLLRFKCVCKSFCIIIDSHDFIKWHRTTTSDNRSHRKLIFGDIGPSSSGDDFNLIPTLVLDMDDPFRTDNVPNNTDHYKHNSIRFDGFFAHCNGLVLLGEEDFSMLGIWNPSTRQYRRLPLFHKKKSQLEEHLVIGWGFGYDSSMDDYKVLIVMEEWEVSNRSAGYHVEFLIFGLRSGYWKRLEHLHLPYHRRYKYEPAYNNVPFIDGAFHFLFDGVDTIFAFDVANDTFSQICLPSFDYDNEVPVNLQVLEGHLCISILPHNLYVGKKDGDEFSWNKLLSVPSGFDFYYLPCCQLLGYSKGGDKIFLLDDCQRNLYSYDFGLQKITETGKSYYYYPKLIFYIESLASVDYPVFGAEEAEVEESNSESSLGIGCQAFCN